MSHEFQDRKQREQYLNLSDNMNTQKQSLSTWVILLLPLASSFVVPHAFRHSRLSGMPTTRRHMFTGIIEEMGTVVSLEDRDDMTLWDGSTGSGTELSVRGNVVMEGAYLGCSICVSGVCLTATDLDMENNIFKVGLAPETLRRTYFRDLKPGSAVNLERASEIGGRNSGHFVQGHVDGTGAIVDRWVDEDSLFFRIRTDPEILKYIVEKGFIAIDGTSLTVCDVDPIESTFTFMLIEFTQKKIVVAGKQKGELVNLEVDILGKYSENTMLKLIPRIEALEARIETLEKQSKDGR